MTKKGDFCQKSQFRSKIEISVKNPNFGQSSKFLSKIQVSVKNPNFAQNSMTEISSEIYIFEISSFDRKLDF